MVPFDHIGYRQQLDIQEDVKYIKADFLIHQIELAFNQWQTRPWNEGVDFENFKEYLLPYRVENEPLDYWRDSISPLQRTWKPTRLITIIFVTRSLKSKTDFALFYSC